MVYSVSAVGLVWIRAERQASVPGVSVLPMRKEGRRGAGTDVAEGVSTGLQASSVPVVGVRSGSAGDGGDTVNRFVGGLGKGGR